MSASTKPLEELIQELPPPLRAEVQDFVEFLLSKRNRPRAHQLRQDWAGMAKSEQLSSVELQHRALEWRAE